MTTPAKECVISKRDSHKRYMKSHPWAGVLSRARSRCNDKNNHNFHRYGGRGIRCLLSMDEMKALWLRDGAASMVRPSIDRIDNDGHYSMDNCRFIEHSDNSARRSNASPLSSGRCIRGHARTDKNTRWKKHGGQKRSPSLRCLDCHREDEFLARRAK